MGSAFRQVDTKIEDLRRLRRRIERSISLLDKSRGVFSPFGFLRAYLTTSPQPQLPCRHA